MKGIVFNVLEAAVEAQFGADAWDALLVAAGLDGAYTSIGSYGDEEIAALVEAAGAQLGLSRGEVLRWFGMSAMPLLKARFPALFAQHGSSRSFVLGVNNMIHPEVRKLYAGAACPMFHFREAPDGSVSMGYASSRRMCELADGFVRGAAKLFCEEVEIHHSACMNQGHASCKMELRWAS